METDTREVNHALLRENCGYTTPLAAPAVPTSRATVPIGPL